MSYPGSAAGWPADVEYEIGTSEELRLWPIANVPAGARVRRRLRNDALPVAFVRTATATLKQFLAKDAERPLLWLTHVEAENQRPARPPENQRALGLVPIPCLLASIRDEVPEHYADTMSIEELEGLLEGVHAGDRSELERLNLVRSSHLLLEELAWILERAIAIGVEDVPIRIPGAVDRVSPLALIEDLLSSFSSSLSTADIRTDGQLVRLQTQLLEQIRDLVRDAKGGSK